MQVDHHIKITGTKSLDPGLEILTAPSTNQEGHAVRFRLKLKQLSSNSFSNSSLDENGDSPKNRGNRRGIGSSKLKVITNNLANNWRLKSLQSKHERRERRATKTLAVVLGKHQKIIIFGVFSKGVQRILFCEWMVCNSKVQNPLKYYILLPTNKETAILLPY